MHSSRLASILGVFIFASLSLATTGCKTDEESDCTKLLCNGVCVDYYSDPANCGACGRTCGANEACSGAVCTPLSRDMGAGDDANVPDGGNVGDAGDASTSDLGSDAMISMCEGDMLNCDSNPDCEVDGFTDRAHCGSCSNVCENALQCWEGRCTCGGAGSSCSDGCFDLGFTSSHCGSCTTACASGEVCISGNCVVSECPEGMTLCAGSCVLLGNDVHNCGACGNACGSAEICAGGRCDAIATASSGCADGMRDGFRDATAFPNIAACSGGFTVPGVFPAPERTDLATCAMTGDDAATNAAGTGCSAADLCGAGWHICRGGEISERTSGMSCNAATDFPDQSFYAAAVSGTGCDHCALPSDTTFDGCSADSCTAGCHESPSFNNDLFGCGHGNGRLIGTSEAAACDGLNASGSDDCMGLAADPSWSCTGSVRESQTITRIPATTPTCVGTTSCSGGEVCCGTADGYRTCTDADACSVILDGVAVPDSIKEGGVLCCR